MQQAGCLNRMMLLLAAPTPLRNPRLYHRVCPILYEKQARFRLHMQPMNVAMSSSDSEGRQLHRRLDVRVETSLFVPRPLLLWAFQSSKKQLQAICDQRPSLLHATAAQGHAFGSHFGAKYRQSLLTCSRLSVTLAVRFMCFRSACAVTHECRQAACILSRRYEFPGRLGEIAAAPGADAGFVRAIGSEGAGNGQFQSPLGGVAFDGDGNLVVSDGWNHRIQVFRYIDGAHLRTIGCRGEGNGQLYRPWGIAFDGAGHIIVSESGNHRVQVLRYSDGAHVRTIASGLGQFLCPTSIAVDGEGNVAVYDNDKYLSASAERRRLHPHHRQQGQRQRAVRRRLLRCCV
jgi:hypothetical protein